MNLDGEARLSRKRRRCYRKNILGSMEDPELGLLVRWIANHPDFPIVTAHSKRWRTFLSQVSWLMVALELSAETFSDKVFLE